MGIVVREDNWRISDALWEVMGPLLPVPKDKHPFGATALVSTIATR